MKYLTLDDADAWMARFRERAADLEQYLKDKRWAYTQGSIPWTPAQIDDMVERDRRGVEFAKLWPSLTTMEREAYLTPGGGGGVVLGTAADIRRFVDIAAAKESQRQSQRASGPHAIELRDDITRIWNKLAKDEMPERNRTKAISERMRQPLKTVDYHIRNLRLRTKKKSKA
jgi:hypothetical protein